jgi:hypothetical protein
MMFTAIQKISISIISVMCILMAVFGIFNKQSYNSITTDNSAFDNAVLYDYASFEEEENNFSENINVEYINDQLKNADTIFVGTVKDIKNQYECLRYTINIDKVVKGKNINISETVVLYEYSHFILNENNELEYFQTVTKNLPLQKNKQYLLFAERLEYEKDYQQTLKHKEFRIFDAEISTFCITNNQDKALKSNAKQFRDIKNNEYICFSSKALNNINSIKRKIIDMYLK